MQGTTRTEAKIELRRLRVAELLKHNAQECGFACPFCAAEEAMIEGEDEG